MTQEEHHNILFWQGLSLLAESGHFSDAITLARRAAQSGRRIPVEANLEWVDALLAASRNRAPVLTGSLLDLEDEAQSLRDALSKYKGTGEVLAPSCGCQAGGDALWKCTHLVPSA